MRKVVGTTKRALSIVELVVVLALTSIAMTASFAVVSGLAGGDQTVFTSAEQTAEVIKNDFEQDVKQAFRCPATGNTIAVNVAGNEVHFPVLNGEGEMHIVTWSFSSDSESVTRSLSTPDLEDCSADTEIEAVNISSRIASATFETPSSDSVTLNAQIRSGSNSLYGLSVFASR